MAKDDRQPDPPAAPQAAKPEDVVYVYEQSSPGEYGVIRHRDERLELGKLSAARDGQPIHGQLVRLSPRDDGERLFDVEVLHDARPPPRTASGPPQVATQAYRAHWERIFGAGRGTPEGSGTAN
jgi:hypothetical protein